MASRTLAAGDRIAFLGTGIMGFPMARRLRRAGFAVAAWNRTRAKAEGLAADGIEIADEPGAAVAGAASAILMVTDGPACDAVLLQADGTGRNVSDSLSPGAVVIVMSSIPVETARRQAERLAERGVAYIDAPVSGGEIGAKEGTLTIMAGGPAEAVAAAGEVFRPLGRVTRVGEAGAGSLAKLANQLIVGVNIGAVAEAFAMAAEGGADLSALKEALTGGFADSRILQVHGQRMIERGFRPGGTVAVTLKDLKTATGFAGALGLDLPFLALVERLYGEAVAHGDGGLDQSALYREILRRNNLRLEDKQ